MTSLTLSLLVALTTALYASQPTPNGTCTPDAPESVLTVVGSHVDVPVTAGAATLGSKLGKCDDALTSDDTANKFGEMIVELWTPQQFDSPSLVNASAPFTLDTLFGGRQRDELVMCRNGCSMVASPRTGFVGTWRNPETEERYHFTETGHVWRMGGADQSQSQLCGVWQAIEERAMVTMFAGDYRHVAPSVSNGVIADPSQEPFFPLFDGDQVVLERVESAALTHTSED